ncbi:hypothetical protein [Teredinibacter turnerae]|uniref:hypothetical protein n=1 Tax=Teredinibacter turnerae TaxID=2426 RepID=UPI0030D419AE
MKKFVKYIVYAFAILILCFIGLMVLAGLMFGDSRGCGKDSEAAEYARSVSQERLAKLYKDMEIYYLNSEGEFDDIYLQSNQDIPIEFRDLEVVRISPGRNHIMVEGCFDNYMYMYFRGISTKEEKEIILSYGEFEVINEKLWPK